MAKVTQQDYQAAVEASLKPGIDNGAGLQDTDIPDDAEQEETQVEETDEPETEAEETSVEPTYKKGQVESIVKTRVGTLQKKIDRLTGFQKAVDKLCEITGLNFDALTARLENMSIDQQAQILGKTPDEVRQVREAQKEQVAANGKLQSMTRQLEEQTLKSDVKFHDFDLYKEEIDELVQDNPKLSLKQAYMLAKGDTAIIAASRDAEQRAIAKAVNMRSKGVVSPIGGVGDKGMKLDAATISAAKSIGMDPLEYKKYQSIDNLDAFRASKKKG